MAPKMTARSTNESSGPSSTGRLALDAKEDLVDFKFHKSPRFSKMKTIRPKKAHKMTKLNSNLTIPLIYASLALFVALSLLTHNYSDPSFSSFSTSAEVKNACGYVGSFFSDLAFQALGFAAWLLPAGLIFAAFRTYRLNRGQSVVFSWLHFAILPVVLSSLIALYWPTSVAAGGHMWAGAVGGFVTGSLLYLLNFVGVNILLWTFVITYLINFVHIPSLSLPSFRVSHLDFGIFQTILKFFDSSSKQDSEDSKLKQDIEDYKNSMDKGPSRVSEKLEVNKLETFEATDMKMNFPVLQTHSSEHKAKQNLIPLARRMEHWEFPKLDLLDSTITLRTQVDEKEIRQKASLLVNKFEQFSVQGEVVAIKTGPAVSLFEFKPNVDVKISRITDLADDLSMALSSESVRIIAPIPGRNVVGIETSNSVRETVLLKDIVSDPEFWNETIRLPIALGKQADGLPKVVDLRKMPHLLVAGTTGSGKSVFVVSLISALLFRHSPKTLRLVLIDPKQVDLAAFSDVPHLLVPPVTEPKKAVASLKWAVQEMEKRYRSMSFFATRGIEAFNDTVSQLNAQELEKHELEQGRDKLNDYYFRPLPYIVIVVEEFGDLMAVDKSNVEHLVVRLAQMARACGIHLILAMQSPRRDVVTGLIKTNIPGRISFKVASKTDSRIILDESGAERLLAQGDMLFLAPGFSKPQRHHGAWLSEKEVKAITEWWSQQGEPDYDLQAMRLLEGSREGSSEESSAVSSDLDDSDDRYEEVLEYILSQKEVSASLLQRRFRLGYPRAARMIELFEQKGVIGVANGSKPRPVLVNQVK